MNRLFHVGPFSQRLLIAVIVAGLGLVGTTARAEATNAPVTNATNSVVSTNAMSPADKAWQEVAADESKSWPTPPEWQKQPPTSEAQSKFMVPILLHVGDEARNFYTRYSDHPKSGDARLLEHQMLSRAAWEFGDTNSVARVKALDTERLKDPKLSEMERFMVRADSIQELGKQLPDSLDKYSDAALAFQKDYPQQQASYQFLSAALAHGEGDEKQALAKRILESPSMPASVQQQMLKLLKQLEPVGKPVSIQFTAEDGRAVDVAALKGKVVLVDFWATWCGPCVGEVPHVKEAYDKLHARGFEIVGISLDQNESALKNFVTSKSMAWPQYFDGGGFGNKFAQRFGIEQIPTMWLVDKKGILRDVDARGHLEESVTRSLAE